MAADVSVSLDLEAKALYAELAAVQSRINAFGAKVAAETEGHGQNAGYRFGQALGRGIRGVGETVVAAARTLFASVTALFGGISIGAVIGEIAHVVKLGGTFKDLSDRVGISAETLSQWAFAAETAGVSAEQVAKSIAFLEKTRERAVQQGPDSPLAQSYGRLGVTFEELSNKGIKITEIMRSLGAGSLNASDGALVMGRSFAQMAPVLEQVSNGSLQLGRGISDIDAAKLDAIGDAFTNLKNAIAVDLAPIIVGAFESIEDHFDIFLTHVKEAVVQLTALNAAGKSKTPSEFFDALKRGSEETDKLEQDLFNRQTEREKKRALQKSELLKPKTSKIGELSGEEGEAGETKAEKKAAREEEKETKEQEREEAELAALREKNDAEEEEAAFKKLSLTEQRNALIREQLDLQRQINNARDEEDRIQAKMESRKIGGQIEDLNKKIIAEAEAARAKEPKPDYTGLTLREALRKQSLEETGPKVGEFPETVEEYQERIARTREQQIAEPAKLREQQAREEAIRRELANPLISKDRKQELKEQLKGLGAEKDEAKLQQSIDYLRQIEENTRGVGSNK